MSGALVILIQTVRAMKMMSLRGNQTHREKSCTARVLTSKRITVEQEFLEQVVEKRDLPESNGILVATILYLKRTKDGRKVQVWPMYHICLTMCHTYLLDLQPKAFGVVETAFIDTFMKCGVQEIERKQVFGARFSQ